MRSTTTETKTFEGLTKLAKEAAYISPKEYRQNNVKRGLRNANGTGVIVGVTRISDVVGYEVDADGNKVSVPGEMFYRGINMVDLVKDLEKEGRFGYEEVVYLLLFNQLPKKSDLTYFESLLNDERQLPDSFKEGVILTQPSSNIMNYLQKMILNLYSYNDDPDNTSLPSLLAKGISIIAKMPTMIAYGYMAQQHYFNHDSLILHSPIYASSAENILHMVRKNSDYTEEEARLLDLLLIVHAEHGGGNNSAFTTNVVSSSGTDIYSTLAAAIGSLKGVKHGGANLKAAEMLRDMYDNLDSFSEGSVEKYLELVLDGKAYDRTGLIYGMGHAVYTVTDPRAELLKEGLDKMTKGTEWEEAFQLLKCVESSAKRLLKKRRGDDFEISANVDLYSGFVYKLLGIPEELYTPIFATARMAGWLAHVLEQTSDGKIMRPGYANICNDIEYVPLADRD